MLGMIIPPGTSLTVDQLKSGGFWSRYMSSKTTKVIIPSLIEFLKVTKFTPTKESARAYFKLHDIMPNPENLDNACAELLQLHSEEMEMCFNTLYSRKLVLLCKVMQNIRPEYNEVRHPDIVARMLELNKYDRTSPVTYEALLIEIRAAQTKELNQGMCANVGRQMTTMVGKKAVITRLKELANLASYKTSPEKYKTILTQLEIIWVSLFNDTVYNYECRNETDEPTLYDYRHIAEQLIFDVDKYDHVVASGQAERFHTKEGITDIDPVAIMLTPCMQPTIFEYATLDQAILQPGYRTVLAWHVVEVCVLRANLKSLDLVPSDEGDGKPIRAEEPEDY